MTAPSYILIFNVSFPFSIADVPTEIAEKEVVEELDLDLDDSGPYEEIDEDINEDDDKQVPNNRPPVKRLPSFIPLSSGEIDNFQNNDKDVEEDEEEFEERLI